MLKIPALLEHFQHVISECVSVLLKETIDIIEYLPSIVVDTKFGIVHLRLDVIGVVLEREGGKSSYNNHDLPSLVQVFHVPCELRVVCPEGFGLCPWETCSPHQAGPGYQVSGCSKEDGNKPLTLLLGTLMYITTCKGT